VSNEKFKGSAEILCCNVERTEGRFFNWTTTSADALLANNIRTSRGSGTPFSHFAQKSGADISAALQALCSRWMM